MTFSKEIEIIQPDDWHVHFRDNDILELVLPQTSLYYRRAIVMPNLTPPILTGKDAYNYKKRINKAIPNEHNFTPLMTVYLTEESCKDDIKESFLKRDIFAAKLYPAGATTNSESGVKNISKIITVLQTMSEIGMPLLIHGEVTEENVDIYDREKKFIDTILEFIIKEVPELKITLEHITTSDSVEYILSKKTKIAGSITPHHLVLNRNHMFQKGIRPHYYCLPILKREEHRLALIRAATSGNKKFFLGTDTAPHEIHNKENDCGCAGIFHTSKSFLMLTQIFDDKNALHNLEAFSSVNGALHYGLNKNIEKIKLKKTHNPINFPGRIENSNIKIKSFVPTFNVYWDIKTFEN